MNPLLIIAVLVLLVGCNKCEMPKPKYHPGQVVETLLNNKVYIHNVDASCNGRIYYKVRNENGDYKWYQEFELKETQDER